MPIGIGDDHDAAVHTGVSTIAFAADTSQTHDPRGTRGSPTLIMPPSHLRKRAAHEMLAAPSPLEAAMTEYYRQECLRALYKHAAPASEPSSTLATSQQQCAAKRKRVSIAPTPEIIGSADPHVDRRPIDVSPFSQFEMLLLLAQRTFPVQA